MLKALLKKQFLELNTFYFQNKKTGKKRSKAGIIGYIVLYAAIFLMLGVTFFGVGSMMAPILIPLDLDWLYFALVGLIAIFLGVFGDVFNTYAGLYHAKDNELLLSMPVPPSKILFVRMVGVYAMGLLYEGLVFIPAVIAYWVNARVTALNVICPVLLFFIMGVFVMTLSCALGWVVALISSRLKNKSIITVILTLGFLALYYVVYFRMINYLEDFAAHAESIGRAIKTGVYPAYAMGQACTGDLLSLLMFTLIVAALFALTYYILQRSFLKIATMKDSGKKAAYREQPVKVSSVKKALLRKEGRRFLGSPTYMLNGGLGLVIAAALAVFVLIRMNWIHSFIDPLAEALPEFAPLLPLAVVLATALIVCMNAISAPSVSLEGKSLWMLQSLPVSAWDVLDAKRRFAMYLNMGPAVLCTVVLGVAVRADIGVLGYMLLFTIVFVMFMATAGVALNLRHPNLTWTNETVPIKQSASVSIAMFGGWALVMLIGLGGWLLRNVLEPDTYILAVMLVLAFATRCLIKWLMTRGAEIFASL